MSADVAARAVDPGRIAAGVAALGGQSAFAEEVRWRPVSLAFGDAGTAVLCAALDAADPAAGWDRVGHRFLSAAVTAFDEPDGSLSLFVGGTGVLAAAGLLSRGGTRYAGLRGQLAAALLPTLDRVLATAGAHESGYDVVHGLSGWTAALLLDAGTPTRVLSTFGDALARLGPDFPQPGLAHGASGPLAALALLDRRVPGLRTAIRALANRVATADFENGSWCVGRAGAARALWLAARALDDVRLGERAQELALLDTEHRTPAFCHGTAGALLVSALFWWDTGDERHRTHAARLCTRLLDAYEPDTVFGFRDVEPGGSTVDNPGLLVGAAGIALVLTALTAPRPPAWPRLFLVA
ncbi:lanthionine synthetase LanC family protein [Amycolatopsis sp. NPDC058278]|uniref:lanthionine synthetase LanC family protein n=1 Tax=Amycolatopsis sp. NPDC058278 TaxID=3346417 RepID=UPI0036D941B6